MSRWKMKILIHAVNGIGLGHVVRTKRIADALQKLRSDVDIVFASNTKYTAIFGDKYKIYPLTKDSRSVAERKYSYREYMQYTTMALEKIISHENPDVVLFDCDFSKKLLLFCKSHSIKVVYILRNSKSERFLEIRKCFPFFDSIIIPHEQNDVSSDQRECLDSFSANFVGPITDPYVPLENVIRENILITLGAGANIPDNKPLFSAIDSFLGFLRKNNSEINNQQIKVDIVTGPYYEGVCDLSGFKVRSTTDSLVRDMYKAKVVISAAGYNTINEILSSRTPAVVVPLPRYWDNQFQRAEKFEKLGCMKVVEEKVLDSVKNVLNDWQKYHESFPHVQSGNMRAAEILSGVLFGVQHFN